MVRCDLLSFLLDRKNMKQFLLCMITCSLLASSLFGAAPASSSSTTSDEVTNCLLCPEKILAGRAVLEVSWPEGSDVQALKWVSEQAVPFAAVLQKERNARVAIEIEAEREYNALVQQAREAAWLIEKSRPLQAPIAVSPPWDMLVKSNRQQWGPH